MGQRNKKRHQGRPEKGAATRLRDPLTPQDPSIKLHQTIAIPIVRDKRTRFSQHGLHVWPYRPHEDLVISH